MNALKKKFNVEAKLDSLNFSFPLRFSLVDFEIKDLSFAQATIDLGAINPISNTLTIDRLYIKGLKFSLDKDKLSFMRLKDNALREEEAKDISIASSLLFDEVFAYSGGGASIIPVKINDLILDDASIIFRDDEQNPPLSIRLEGIDALIENFKYPTFSKFYLEITSSLSVNEKKMKDVLNITGWVDWSKKDMDVFFQAKEIDYFTFDDYYPPFWKTKNLELKEASLSLASYLVSKDDDLLIDYYIILNRAVFNEPPQNEEKVKNLKKIIAFLKKNGESIVHLTDKTKMSSPEFKITSIGDGILKHLQELEVLADTFNRLFGKTQDTVENGVKGLKGLTIDPTVGAVKGFVEEFLKNLKKIIGKGKDNDN